MVLVEMKPRQFNEQQGTLVESPERFVNGGLRLVEPLIFAEQEDLPLAQLLRPW